MSSNRYSYNMYPLSDLQTDKGNRKFMNDYESSIGGGDYTLDMRDSNVSVFLEEPTYNEDPADWNKADYKYNIQFLKKYIINQKRYLQQEEDNFARNKDLIANMKATQQRSNDESTRKRSEIQKIKIEIEDFKSQIRKNVETINNYGSQFLCEEEVNRDLKVQIRRLTKRRELQLRKQTEEGISDDVIEAYDSAKKFLESEKERKERLMKKDNWYTKEIAAIREVLANEDGNASPEGVEIEKVSQDEDDCTSNNNTVYFLPEMNNIRTCLMSPEPIAGRFQGKGNYRQRNNALGHISNLPPLSNAQENISCPLTVTAEDDNVDYLPNSEVKYGHASHSPAAAATHERVPHPPTVADAHDHSPQSLAAAAKREQVHRAPATSSPHTNAPHLPTVVATKENVCRPRSGKKDGAFRRFFRKLRNVIK